MFKREYRLSSTIRFKNSFSFSNPQFILRVQKNGFLFNRFGVVVSKKIDKKAVVRNRIKRTLRSVLTDLNKNIFPGHDILIIARVGARGTKKSDVALLVETALKKSGIIK